mmetsp:Transcript_26992/g.71044  ORF Transcript_26992/g.71044 Transcript_26992/m.71044 type:complete len:186 (-) Transcript_26992:65-622(-)
MLSSLNIGRNGPVLVDPRDLPGIAPSTSDESKPLKLAPMMSPTFDINSKLQTADTVPAQQIRNARVLVQTQQIDRAISLLKMQYNALMMSIASQCEPMQTECRTASHPAHPVTEMHSSPAHRHLDIQDIKSLNSKAKGKLVLDAKAACMIYELRPNGSCGQEAKSKASKIGSTYGVTGKTIRDIW